MVFRAHGDNYIIAPVARTAVCLYGDVACVALLSKSLVVETRCS